MVLSETTKSRVVLAVLSFFAAVFVGASLVLHGTYNYMKAYTPSDTTTGEYAHAVDALDDSPGRATIDIRGWAYNKAQAAFAPFDCRIVLLHTQTGHYYEVATQMQVREDVAQYTGQDFHRYAGATASIPKANLPDPAGTYEVCFDLSGRLVPTGHTFTPMGGWK